MENCNWLSNQFPKIDSYIDIYIFIVINTTNGMHNDAKTTYNLRVYNIGCQPWIYIVKRMGNTVVSTMYSYSICL